VKTVKAIRLGLLFVGLLTLTGCKTETITQSSLWQMLPFVSTKPKEEPVKNENPPPKPVANVAPKAVAIAVAEEKPIVTPAAPAPVEAVAKSNPTKKSKRPPPAEPIGMPVAPSTKQTQSALRETTGSVSPSSTTLIQNTPSPQPFRLSDWLYDEKLHEEWRAKQLEQAKEREPIHQYESAQLNRAFYNVILNEPSTEVKTDKAEPKP
jgi:hypothetical protein